MVRSSTTTTTAKPSAARVTASRILSSSNRNSPRVTKVKCSTFKSLLGRATWFQAEIPNVYSSLESAQTVIAGLVEHLNSSCNCAAKSSTRLVIASSYLYEFYLVSRNVINNLDKVERQVKEKGDSSTAGRRQGVTGEGGAPAAAPNAADTYKSDYDEKVESKFTSKVNDQVTIGNFKHLIKHAVASLIFYENALVEDETEKFLNQKLIASGWVLANLNALFNIFTFYELPNLAFRAAETACQYADRYCLDDELDRKISFTSSEEIQITYCNMVRLLLSFGCLDAASAFFKRHFSSIKFEDNIKTIETYGQAVIFLIIVELHLRLRKGKAYCDKLKEFLESDYFSKNTIKRYAIKIMTLLLASQFPSAVFKFTHNFVEFTEPLQMAVSVCKRWSLFSYFFRSTAASSEEEQLDPLWYRYLIFNLVSSTGTVFMHFYTNSGLLNDASFYYKMILNLNVLTLNVVGASNALLLAADIDCKGGFANDAKLKMSSVRNLLMSPLEQNEQIFQSHKNSNRPSPSVTKTKTIRRTRKVVSAVAGTTTVELPEVDDPFVESEKTTSMVTDVMVSYRNAMRLVLGNMPHYTGEDDFDDLSVKMPEVDLANLVLREFEQLKRNGALFHGLFYMALKIVVINQMLEHQEGVHNYASTHFAQLLTLLESFTILCHVEGVQQMVKGSRFVSSVKTNMEQQLFHGPCGTYFWHIASFYIRKLVDGQQYKEALCYLNKLMDFSTYSFETRVSRCTMFYYRALVIYRLLKPTFTSTRKSILTVGCDKLLSSKSSSPDIAHVTTPPKTSKNNEILPNAPKRGTNMSTVKKYAASLLEKAIYGPVGKESLEGTRRIGKQIINFEHCESSPTVEPNGKSTCDNENSKSCRKTSRPLKIQKTASRAEFSIYQEGDQNQDEDTRVENNLVGNFNQLKLDSTSISSIDSYFGREFNVVEFVNSFDLSKYSLADVKTCLNKVTCYIGLHPSWALYQNVHYMYFKLARANSKNSLLLLYHLAESAEHASYRYRNIIISQRKANLSKGAARPYKPDFSHIQFKCEDFAYLPYANDLPRAWRFLQIKFCDNGTKIPDILFARFQPDSKPVFFKVSTRHQTKLSKYFLEEFAEIMKGNNTSMTEVVRQVYWKIRHEYDSRLTMLLQSFEFTYLGPFKALLLGESDNASYRSACSDFKRCLVSTAAKLGLECVDWQLLDVFAESVIFLEAEELVAGAQILYNFEDSKVADEFKLSKAKRTYFREWSTEKKIVELFKSIAPVGLILDGAMAQFPIESLPTVRKIHQPMFRIPSLRVASILYNQFKNSPLLEEGVNDKNCFYVVNPSANLAQTEQFFSKKFHDITKVEKNWSGVIGREPTSEELKSNLQSKDLYIYFGHGSGSIYYRKVANGGIDALQLKPASIVIGCSSGRVWAEGKMEATYGVPYRFLVNGAPCYIGNLWDVTDKDIDTFSDKFLSYCSLRWKSDEEEKEPSLARAIALSRDACRLKFLIGSSPVVYGLPLKTTFTGLSEFP